MMMNELIVDVKLYGQNVGVLSWNEKRGLAEFQYYPEFLRSGLEVSPLVMPLKKSLRDYVFSFPTNRNNCFHGLPGMIADALPDKYGNEIINSWFAAHGVPDYTVTPLDRLCYIGCRAMGGLEFYPNKNINGLNESTILKMDTLVELADKVYKDRDNFKECIRQQDKAILDILKIGTSAGGAKPKAIIALNERTNEVRSGQVVAPSGFTYWLIKFDGTTFNENGTKIEHPKGIGNIEYAYYKMARDCRIDMSECKLLQEQDSWHFMTRRFDRTDDGQKIHMQTLAAIAHFDRDSRHSYEEGFSVIRRLGLGYDANEQFYRRMVFNVVARNHDDHTKNHSFLMDKQGRWSLAPAYDLCYSYSPSGKWTSMHQMSVNGKQDYFEWNDLAEVGRRMDIKNTDAIIAEIVEVVSLWKKYAKDCGVYDNHAQLIDNNLRLLNPPVKYKATKEVNNSNENTAERITDIRIASRKNGGMYITCKIDGIKQIGERLKSEDVHTLNDDTDLVELATRYFKSALDRNQQQSQGMKR